LPRRRRKLPELAAPESTLRSRESGSRAPPLAALGVGKTFGAEDGRPVNVIGSVSFDLREGEIVSIVGPSGCGKTTLLNLICGLLPPWRTAVQSVTLGLEVRRVGGRERLATAHGLLERLGLGEFADYYPSALSGGMRQRVALARTLASDPEVLLLDEPFSALDFQTKILIERDTARLVCGESRSLLLITHDVEEAVSLSDRVIVLSHRPCTVVSQHHIDLPGDRTDMMAMREQPEFARYVRRIWTELDIR